MCSIKWIKYPENKPSVFDEYIVTRKTSNDYVTDTLIWDNDDNEWVPVSRFSAPEYFRDIITDVVAYAELPSPYRPEE